LPGAILAGPPSPVPGVDRPEYTAAGAVHQR